MAPSLFNVGTFVVNTTVATTLLQRSWGLTISALGDGDFDHKTVSGKTYADHS
jgi:hypothetical protein